MRRFIALALALASSACATYHRGTFGALAPDAVPARTTPLQPVEARMCSDVLVQRFERAVEQALARAPGANALIHASFHFERFCLVVRGEAAHAD